jgi:hypothetical protein
MVPDVKDISTVILWGFVSSITILYPWHLSAYRTLWCIDWWLGSYD